MFTEAARRLRYATVGMLQYIAPTLQFLIGVFVYKEAFDMSHFIGFAIVWAALIIFALESYMANRMPMQPIPELGEG